MANSARLQEPELPLTAPFVPVVSAMKFSIASINIRSCTGTSHTGLQK